MLGLMRYLGPDLTYVQESRSNQRNGRVSFNLVVFPEPMNPGASDDLSLLGNKCSAFTATTAFLLLLGMSFSPF
jgi:hypothetical protein